MKLSEVFEKELSYIENEVLRDIVSETLDNTPEYIKDIPASATGKYHPEYSFGQGGLVRHIKASIGIAKSLLGTEMFNSTIYDYNNFEYNRHSYSRYDEDIYTHENFKDVCYSALLLHDCMKADDTPEHKTLFNHPLLASDLFNKTFSKYFKSDKLYNIILRDDMTQKHDKYIKSYYNNHYEVDFPELLYYMCEDIKASIASHMGEWNKKDDVILPKPFSTCDKFVHLCDFLSSRRFLEYNFEKDV